MSVAVGSRSIRLERRLHVDPRRSALIRVIGLLASLVVVALLLAITGRDVPVLAGEILDTTLGTSFGLQSTAVLATPILLDAIAVAIPLRMRLWNIGVEGQFYVGALAAAGVGIYVDAPGPILLVLMALAGALGGALWILVPALARAFWNVNEIITTLLLNFVAIQWVTWFSIGPWRDKEAEVVSATPEVGARLPVLIENGILHIGFFLPLILAAAFFVVFRSWRWGYEVDMIGGNPRAAEFAGVDVRRRIMSVMLLSGALAGISGMVHLSGASGRLQGTISNQYGLSGFIVAALAGASFVALIAGGLFIALLLASGVALQGVGLSVYIVLAVYGLALIGIGVGEMASRYRLTIGDRREHPVGSERGPP